MLSMTPFSETTPLLIVANKCDHENALDQAKCEELMDVVSFRSDGERHVELLRCSAVSDDSRALLLAATARLRDAVRAKA